MFIFCLHSACPWPSSLHKHWPSRSGYSDQCRCEYLDLHGMILLHTTSWWRVLMTLFRGRLLWGFKTYFKILQRFSCRKHVVKEVACDKIAPCKSAFTFRGKSDVRLRSSKPSFTRAFSPICDFVFCPFSCLILAFFLPLLHLYFAGWWYQAHQVDTKVASSLCLSTHLRSTCLLLCKCTVTFSLSTSSSFAWAYSPC